MRKATHLPEKHSQNILETDFPFSEGAAKENEGRSEYQIKHNTNKGKRKRRWWGEEKHSAGPEHSSLCYTQDQQGRTHTRRQKSEEIIVTHQVGSPGSLHLETQAGVSQTPKQPLNSPRGNGK